MDLFEALRGSYLTEGLSDDDVRDLVGLSEFVDKHELEEVVRANDVSFDLYVLVEGSAEVSQASGEPVSRLRPGAIIGEFAFFENGLRSATVMCLTPSRLLHLDGQKLFSFMQTRP